jgi:crotonobetainyl-CoA:carnitine CoA-transferase CaiB-like acyl-CoA transferase
MHVTGEEGGPPISIGQPICDLGTGMWGVQGILSALYERERTGRGQKVDCSLLETALGFSGGPAPRGWSTAWSPCDRARATARTRRTSGSRRRTVT